MIFQYPLKSIATKRGKLPGYYRSTHHLPKQQPPFIIKSEAAFIPRLKIMGFLLRFCKQSFFFANGASQPIIGLDK
jgi:hypothetical protein